ncbi:SDR family NAD(P)-dependent oxidoreductase [Flexivirga meconopsidis]|uniref:SDR family NAD(P)-dependent oxidoreductase n=1 Tax=Flexivirga meconopsidis TaxID=2977121 RepID=UPI00223F37BE|nr:SDR family oxidoreductase [Flexivirga meconopsidis]
MSKQTQERDRNRISRDEDLADRVVLVTGAAGGIGRAVVQGALRRGARAVVQDLSPSVTELEAEHPGRVVSVVGDAADEAVAVKSVAAARSQFGRLDVLVSNAGTTLNKPLTATSAEEWDRVMRVNVRSAFLLTREAFKIMEQDGGGNIVYVGSFTSTVALAEGSAYTASKGALSQLMKVAAVEGARLGIRANAIAPGVVDTGFLNHIRPDGQEYLRSFGAAHPLGRIAQPSEIADAVLYLAGDESSFVTGALLAVDGGYTAL